MTFQIKMAKIGILINTSRKWLKAFLASKVRKLDFLVAPIFGICVHFLDFLFLNLDESTTISLALPLPPPTTLLLPALNALKANFLDNLIVFNIEVSSTAILLKP